MPSNELSQRTEAELKLIHAMRRRNPNAGLVVFWVKLRQRGYSRSITGLYRSLFEVSLLLLSLKIQKYIPKPYEQMTLPGHVFKLM
jgi:hypothetical protein